MSEPAYVLVAHMGHDGSWLLIKTPKEVVERCAHIKLYKPKAERPLRLKLLKIVKEPLPPKLQKAYAAWKKARAAAWLKAAAAREKADATWQKAINSREGVAFHKLVCGCKWTPKQPDILVANQEE